MVPSGLNSLLLIALGAAFFALSFNKGRAGYLRQSVLFAILACVAGLSKAIDDGVSNRSGIEIFAVLCGYILLPLLGVMISRKLYEASQRSEKSH